jgi:hypothetical protein
MRTAYRSVLHHLRSWIPGSAARPRDDAESGMNVEETNSCNRVPPPHSAGGLALSRNGWAGYVPMIRMALEK